VVTQDTKERILEWVFQQGVSTVLLCGILAFMGYAVIFIVPSHIDQIEKGYQRNAEITAKAIEAIAASHDRDRQMFVDLLNGRIPNGQPK
jgi:hypothetical protein